MLFSQPDSKSNAATSQEKLESAYRNSLTEANKAKLKSIVSFVHFDFGPSDEVTLSYFAFLQAFPSISTGVYGYPMQDATNVAIETVGKFLESKEGKEVRHPESEREERMDIVGIRSRSPPPFPTFL